MKLAILATLPSAVAFAAPTTVDDLFTPDATVFSVPAPGVLGNDITVSGGLTVVLISIGGLQGTVQQFADGIKHASWVIFENSSHLPHVEETERCLKVVGDFLDEHQG